MQIPLSSHNIKELLAGANFKVGPDLNAYHERMRDLKNQVGADNLDNLGFIKPLVDAMLVLATNRYLSSAYGGSHNDGGAGAIVSETAGIVLGYQMCKKGELLDPYKQVVEFSLSSKGPDYERYKQLYKKFEGINPN